MSPHRLAAHLHGDAARWNLRARRLARHVEACARCGQELESLRRSAGVARETLERFVSAQAAEFRPVRMSVRARLAAQQRTSSSPAMLGPRRGGWSLALPAAAVMAGLAVLVLRPALDPSRAPTSEPEIAQRSAAVEMSSTVDGVVRIQLPDSPAEEHRVAVSTRAWDFSKAEVFEVQGRNWVDPTPDPPAGQAYFYRVD